MPLFCGPACIRPYVSAYVSEGRLRHGVCNENVTGMTHLQKTQITLLTVLEKKFRRFKSLGRSRRFFEKYRRFSAALPIAHGKLRV
ncbi:MAG TPA: hypothetical protein DCZ07_01085 [Alphaproteobacteria bacterium]|jgi:hypothetical protein|nr:hypothetical protein [Alphaproteobacteria bacterium]HBC54137.1 hypothetical protein [Alphaproteobacteria bacterium]